MHEHMEEQEEGLDQTLEAETTEEVGLEEHVEDSNGTEPDETNVVQAEPEPLQGQLLRLRADFDNYRKRTEREKGEWTHRANERLVDDILPVLDTFELALADAEQREASEDVVQGFRMVQTMLLTALGKHGLQAVDASGEAFDPNFHEAISRMASDDIEADHVLAQTRRGYRMGEKLVRPAQVVVSTGPAQPDGEA